MNAVAQVVKKAQKTYNPPIAKCGKALCDRQNEK
jgi:hypothetical protein